MKKLILIVFLVSGVGFSFLYYYWRQATWLPEWYTTSSADSQRTLNLSDESDIIAAQARLQAKIDASIAEAQEASPETMLMPYTRVSNSGFDSSQSQLSRSKNVEIELNDTEVNELILTTVAKKIAPSQVAANVPSFHTTIKDGVIETGAVVNLSDLPRHQMANRKQATLERAIATFPFLKNQDIYIGVSGTPQIANGQLKLDDSAKVKLGNLSLTLSELAQRLDITETELKSKLNLSLPLENVKVNDLKLDGNKVLLRGSVQ